MVIHYQPGQLRRDRDQPTAITGVQLATSPLFSRTGEIPLGTPTCSARTRHGSWALYQHGTDVVVVWPGGALAGPPLEVAGELDRLDGDRHDHLDHAAAHAIRQFLTDPAAQDAATWSATRARTWSRPAVSYWLSGPTNQHGRDADTPAAWPAHPARPPQPPTTLPDPRPEPTPTPARAA
jgi:hypothetical protein